MNGARTLGGFTLLELVVVLAVMGIAAGLATLAFRSLLADPGQGAVDWPGQLREARRSAVMAAHPVVLRPLDRGAVLLLPDGRVIGDGVDPLTGALEPLP